MNKTKNQTNKKPKQTNKPATLSKKYKTNRHSPELGVLERNLKVQSTHTEHACKRHQVPSSELILLGVYFANTNTNCLFPYSSPSLSSSWLALGMSKSCLWLLLAGTHLCFLSVHFGHGRWELSEESALSCLHEQEAAAWHYLIKVQTVATPPERSLSGQPFLDKHVSGFFPLPGKRLDSGAMGNPLPFYGKMDTVFLGSTLYCLGHDIAKPLKPMCPDFNNNTDTNPDSSIS